MRAVMTVTISHPFAAPGRRRTERLQRAGGRGSRIRTCDLKYPKLPRYQAALYPDCAAVSLAWAALPDKPSDRQGLKRECRTRSPGFSPIFRAKPALTSSTL